MKERISTSMVDLAPVQGDLAALSGRFTPERKVLIVEDEKPSREALAKLLSKLRYGVTKAASGRSAINKAAKGSPGVVLMDIRLGKGIDGIDAACKIQGLRPLSSFIFMSAYSHEDNYKERVHASKIRVGGWLVKPVTEEKLTNLEPMIDKEDQKLKVLAAIDKAQQRGLDPQAYFETLVELADLSPPIVDELRAELRQREGRIDCDPTRSKEADVQGISTEIDRLYDEIGAVAADRAGHADLAARIAPLRRRLRALQQAEVAAMDRGMRAKFQFDSREGARILRRAARLLGKR